MKIARHVAATLLLSAAVIAGMIAFGASAPPPPLASIGRPFLAADFSDMPQADKLPASNAAAIAYRHWPAKGPDNGPVVIAIHGSSASSSSMHPLAKALATEGIATYAPDIRGHGDTGQRGDIDYATQLDDDIAEIAAMVKARHPQSRLILLGMSSGGGFALHLAATPVAKTFDRAILLAPMLGIRSPTVGPQVYKWAAPSIPRIIGLRTLNKIGIHAFDHLPVLSFAIMPEHASRATPHYSLRLMRGFGTLDYAEDLRKAAIPVAILVGDKDELFEAGKFAPTVQAIRTDVPVTVIPGLNHIEMITDARAVPPILAAIRGSN